MAFWRSLVLLFCAWALVKQQHLYISSFLAFLPATCSNSVETMEPAGAPQSGSRAQIDQSQMVLLRVWLCLSCLQNAALNRFLIFWTFFPIPPPSWIYTHSFAMTSAANKEHLALSYKRLTVCWEVSLRALVYPKWSRAEWQTYTDDTTFYIVIGRAMTWSLQTASRWAFSVYEEICHSDCGK